MIKRYVRIIRPIASLYLFLLYSGSFVAFAQSHPVVGAWDVNIGGPMKGGGHLIFADDGTISGYVMLRANPTDKNPPATDVGFFVIDGRWTIASNKRVTGFFNGVSDLECGPDKVLTVNKFGGAVISKGSKLVVTATVSDIVLSVRGTHALAPSVDLSGDWKAKVTKGIAQLVEFFSLSPSLLGPNLYDLVGEGPGYSLSGCLLLFNRERKIALEVQEEPDGPDRNVSGPRNVKKETAYLAGWDQADDEQTSVSMSISPDNLP